MGNFGLLLGFVVSFVLTLLVRWLFPHVWALEAGGIFPMPEPVKIAAWTLFIGFPIGVFLGARQRPIFIMIVLVLVWCPLTALLLFGHHALPPFFLRGHSNALRYIVAVFGLLGGGWISLWIYENIVKGGGWEADWSWLTNLLDRIFGRK
jgi:hypothetical protein